MFHMSQWPLKVLGQKKVVITHSFFSHKMFYFAKLLFPLPECPIGWTTAPVWNNALTFAHNQHTTNLARSLFGFSKRDVFRFYSWLRGRQTALVQTIPDLLYLGMCTPGVPNLLDDKIGAGRCHLGGRYLSTLIPMQRRWQNLNAWLPIHFVNMTLA